MKGTRALFIVTVLALCAGCTATSDPVSAPTPTAPAAPSNAAPPGSPDLATTTVSVPHTPAVPPVPVLERIRYAAHGDEGFDRVVLDIPGALPGYTAKYVGDVRYDGSDKPVALPGNAFLLIVLHPAQAHREDGSTTVSGIHRTGMSGVQAYAIVGDHEGYVSVALGLSGVREYHVGELAGRVYVDVTN